VHWVAVPKATRARRANRVLGVLVLGLWAETHAQPFFPRRRGAAAGAHRWQGLGGAHLCALYGLALAADERAAETTTPVRRRVR
jgi:hypothetical protein